MKVIFAFIMLFNSRAMAHEASSGLVHASFGPFINQTHRESHYFKNPLRSGYGTVVDADVDDHGGLELTLIYLKQTFSIKHGSDILTEEGKRMYIGMGYRHWFTKKFGVAPSFFSSYLMGDPGVVRSDLSYLPTPPVTSARDTVEYGIDLSVQYETFQTKHFAVVWDARYSYSLTPKPHEDGNIYGVMVAFKYFIQGKQPEGTEDD